MKRTILRLITLISFILFLMHSARVAGLAQERENASATTTPFAAWETAAPVTTPLQLEHQAAPRLHSSTIIRRRLGATHTSCACQHLYKHGLGQY
jgi:hypothetical protein